MLGRRPPLLIADSGALSSVATYTLDNIPPDYSFLQVSYRARPATDGTNFRMIARKGAGTDITVYDIVVSFSQTNVWASAFTDDGAVVTLSGTTENTAPQGYATGTIDINDIQSADHKGGVNKGGFYDSATVHFEGIMTSFSINDTAPITGLKFLFSSGNIAAGRIRVLGW